MTGFNDDLRDVPATLRARLILSGIKFGILAAIVAVFAAVGTPTSARAEVGNTADFMPSSWRSSGAAEARTHAATRHGRSTHAYRSAARRAVASSDESRPRRHTRAARSTASASVGHSGGGIAWRAGSGCLASNLRSVIASVAASYGSVTVNSTCRSPGHNRAVGGASHSYHLTGQAADIRVHGNIAAASAFMRSQVGGFKHYGGGRFHIDNGPHRTF